jgi:hypothetical protein
MDAVDSLRKAASWAAVRRAALLGCAFALLHCEDRIAGSSVTTGNPTEIQVGFTGENGPVALSGRVEIFAATQIPVPGFRPEPLARLEVNGTTFSLKPDHFESIADSMWAKGSVEGDSVARFNLVITASDQGSILRDLGIRLKDRKFSLKDGSFTAGMDGAVSMKAGFSAMAAYQVAMDTGSLSLRRLDYLFLYGTGWSATDSAGIFRFPALPAGTYRPSYIGIPTKDSQSQSPTDSVNIYGLDKPIEAGSSSVVRGDVETRIPIPASLR